MGGRNLFTKFLSALAFAALGFIYSSGAFADVVLHGIDGGTTAGDGKFIWSKQCVNTATGGRTQSLCGNAQSPPPDIGYLYKGPIDGKYYRTGTCWNRKLNFATACSYATGFIASSFTHSGVTIEGGGGVTLGEINPAEQLMTVEPGSLGVPATVTVEVPDVEVKGYRTDDPNTSLGKGRFKYRVVYSIPIAGLDPDNDKGGGNQKKAQICVEKCDPQNPKFGKYCTGCVANQTCENVSSTELKFSVKAFCQQGVTVAGYLTWIDPNPDQSGDIPPQFTNCQNDAPQFYTVADAPLPAGAKLGDPKPGSCTVRLGGLPGTNGTIAGLPGMLGTVDPAQCEAIFGEVTLNSTTLALRQLLAFEQYYVGQCSGSEPFGLEKPESAALNVHRVCNSDYGKDGGFVAADPSFLNGQGFDNTQRGCVVAATGELHVVNAQETSKSNAQVQVDITPESLNLKCSTDGKDNGVAKATICGSATFDVTQIDLTKLPVLFVDGSSRVVTAVAPPVIQAATTGACSTTPELTGVCLGEGDPVASCTQENDTYVIMPSAPDTNQDMVLTYATCNATGTGLSQVVLDANSGIQGGDQVNIKLQGQTSGGTLKNIEGSDDVKVVVQ